MKDEHSIPDWQIGGFGLYIHWPFCQSKCPYCDFNSHVSGAVDGAVWRNAMLSELRRYATETPGRTLRSIFFGGGTPSLMDPDLVEALIGEARSLWTPANDLEITLEANPGSIDAGRFAAYRAAGVNRLSMGIQALRDDDLKRLGRTHSAADAIRGYDIARATFDRVSFDLIYGRQGQSLSDWDRELAEAIAMAPSHLSLYMLTIEDGTVFAERKRRGLLHGLPDEDLGADLFALTQGQCDAAGYPAYEISNHARAGEVCRHNLIYWNAGEYVGIGPGAHGRLCAGGHRYATEATRSPSEWLTAVARGEAEVQRSKLSPTERADEYLLMGLRTNAGIDIRRYVRMGGSGLASAKIDHLSNLGLVRLVDQSFFVTAKGRVLLDAILGDLAG